MAEHVPSLVSCCHVSPDNPAHLRYLRYLHSCKCQEAFEGAYASEYGSMHAQYLSTITTTMKPHGESGVGDSYGGQRRACALAAGYERQIYLEHEYLIRARSVSHLVRCNEGVVGKPKQGIFLV
jgi:hypothetical protein